MIVRVKFQFTGCTLHVKAKPNTCLQGTLCLIYCSRFSAIPDLCLDSISYSCTAETVCQGVVRMDCTDAQRWDFSYLVFEYTGSFSCRALQYILQWYMFHYSLSVGSSTGYIVRGNSPARCERVFCRQH